MGWPIVHFAYGQNGRPFVLPFCAVFSQNSAVDSVYPSLIGYGYGFFVSRDHRQRLKEVTGDADIF